MVMGITRKVAGLRRSHSTSGYQTKLGDRIRNVAGDK
jgi:hypothetical protein